MELNDDERNIQSQYNSMNSSWPDNNSWYDYTKKVICDFISANAKITNNMRILNAGSGGSTYGITEEMYHVDLAERQIKIFPKHYVSSIEHMPFEDSFFDLVICVGSVINYNDALPVISEISRVMSPGSELILEYERSFTGELLFKKGYGENATVQIYDYNGQNNHKLWLYSDKYIESLLESAGLKVETSKMFHSVSAVYNRIHNNENKAGRYSSFDSKIPAFIKKNIAHNRIILCSKEIKSV